MTKEIVGEGSEGDGRNGAIKQKAWANELHHAAAETSIIDLKPKPPYLMGKDSCNCATGDNVGRLRIDEAVSIKFLSKTTAEAWKEVGLITLDQ